MDDDLSRFCCRNADCPDCGRRGKGNLTVCGRLWEVSSGRELLMSDGHTKPINAVAVSADGGLGASSDEDFNTFIWELKPGVLNANPPPPKAATRP